MPLSELQVIAYCYLYSIAYFSSFDNDECTTKSVEIQCKSHYTIAMCAFIVLEGPDGSGTTKHTKLLCDRLALEGMNFSQTVEPTNDLLGTMCRTALFTKPLPCPEALQLLFCADRAEHVARHIRPTLEHGNHCISERYSLSTILYGTAAGVDRSWLTAINAVFPQPDLTIITLPPFAVCCERFMSRSQRDGLENVNFQEKVYALYANTQGENTVFVDTSGDPQDVAENIWQIVLPYLQQ